MIKQLRLRDSQQGMVSIIVTMIIMAILSLIVVGFAQLARREQRETLDKQLSTQAFYAAESGINDAVKAIDSGSYTQDKTNCNVDPAFTNIINSTNQVAYTCLLIDQTPEILEYSGIETDKSTVIPIEPVDSITGVPVDLSSLDISWNTADGSGSGYYSSPSNDFPPVGASGWGNREAGILRVDLIPIKNGGFTRANLVEGAYTVFLYPKVGPASPTNVSFLAGPGNESEQGSIRNVNCGAPSPPYFSKKCKAEITGMPTASIDRYYLRVISIYSNSAVTISGVTGTGPLRRQVSFKGTQYVIDSTGKAGDVLKRVRVHKPALNTNYKYPNFALDSADSICKKLSIWPGSGATPGGGTDGCAAAAAVPATPTP